PAGRHAFPTRRSSDLHDEDDGALGIEAELTDDVLVLGARPAPVEDVRLRPTGDDDALRIDAVIASEILSHHLVLDDVAAQVRCRSEEHTSELQSPDHI